MSGTNKILMGMDVSGDDTHSNYEYLGIVIGIHESVMSLSGKMGQYSEHMSELTEPQKRDVVSKLSFDSTNSIAICVRLDRKKIIDGIRARRRIRNSRKLDGAVIRTFNRVIMTTIQSRIEQFALSHKESFTNLIIQGDKDVKGFADAVGLTFTRKGAAYRLSDYIAYCNNRGLDNQIASIIQLDFTNEITEKMLGILGLN